LFKDLKKTKNFQFVNVPSAQKNRNCISDSDVDSTKKKWFFKKMTWLNFC